MAAAVQEPVLHHRRPALVANDRAGVGPSVGRASFRAFDALTNLGRTDDSRGVRRMDDVVRIAVEYDGTHARGVDRRPARLPRSAAAGTRIATHRREG